MISVERGDDGGGSRDAVLGSTLDARSGKRIKIPGGIADHEPVAPPEDATS